MVPVLWRGVAGGENKFEIFAIGDFGIVERCRSKKIHRHEEHP